MVGSLGTAAGRYVTCSDGQWWSSDWQETDAFRQTVSDYVRDFLTLGAGGELDWYNTVLEGTVWQTDGGWWGELSVSEPAVEETVDAAPDAGYQWDKNVLYQILQNGKPLYTNTDQALAYVQGLPEGYNFLLIFKDGKAQAWKDGEELDLYGDGVYSGDSDWYLPGYENFTAGEGVEDVEVRMAVRQVPIQYLQGQYTDGYVFDGSPLYDLYQGLKQVRTLYLEAAAALAAGIGLLVLAHWSPGGPETGGGGHCCQNCVRLDGGSLSGSGRMPVLADLRLHRPGTAHLAAAPVPLQYRECVSRYPGTGVFSRRHAHGRRKPSGSAAPLSGALARPQ